MSRTVLILLGLLVLASAIDYCEITQDSAKVFIETDEIRRLDLSNYVKGFDLTFQADNEIASIQQAFQVHQTKDMGSKSFTSLQSVDVKSYASKVGLGVLSLLATNGNFREVGVWVGEFVGMESLPDVSTFTKFTIPSNLNATCFDVRSINAEGVAVLNCQTIPSNPDEEDPKDLLCLIDKDTTTLTIGDNCNLIPAIAATSVRRSRVLTLNKNIYLLSENKDLQNTNDATLDFITIYHLNDEGKFVFANIIDGSTLANPRLQITDFVVTKDNQILVSDAAQSRLIYYTYSLFNEVTVEKVVGLQSVPLALAITDENHLFVATRQAINQHDAANPSTLYGKYEVDPSDSVITNVQVSDSLVSFTTQTDKLYVYKRGQHKINYLLARTDLQIQTNSFVLSSLKSYLFTFNLKQAQSVAISQPYLSLTGKSQKNSLKITATSQTKTCEVNFKLNFVDSSQDIVNKKTIEDDSFIVDPTDGLQLNLKDYYGGANLKYKASYANLDSPSNGDFTVEIKQNDSYPLKATFTKPEHSYILSIDSTSFYYVGINSKKQNMAYIDLCKHTDDGLTCQSYYKDRVPFQIDQVPVTFIQGKIRANGNSIIAWSYQNTALLCIVNLRRKLPQFFIKGNLVGLPLSSIQISDNYCLVVNKYARYIDVYFEDDAFPTTTVLSDTYFNEAELEKLEYFYPREAVLDPNNPNIFYVKLPTRVARFSVLQNKQVKFIDIVRDFEKFVFDETWTFTFTADNNILTLRNDELKEEHYNPKTNKFDTLQSISLAGSKYSNFHYDASSNFATVAVQDAKENTQSVKVLVPGEGAVDYQYAEMKLSNNYKWSSNWVLDDTNTPVVHYVHSYPTLSVMSNLPDDMFKEDIQLFLDINTATKSQTTKTTVEGVNFPVVIKDKPNTNVITLPSNASSLEMKLNVQDFFSGPIADYSISCPFCTDARISLETSFDFEKNIEQVTAAIDYETVGDYIVALTNNQLAMLNENLQVVALSPIPEVSCNHMAYQPTTGLLLFCNSKAASGQEIIRYSIDGTTFNYESKYELPAEHTIQNFDEMFISPAASSTFVMILNNDETIDSNNKQSSINIYEIKDDAITFNKELNSASFGLQKTYPINDLDIVQSTVLVTLGNYGIGYGRFSDGKLTDVNSINLASLPEIKKIFLTSSYFKQVEMLAYRAEEQEVDIFISSTNSLSMVATFIVDNNKLIYKTITETYFRYGTQRLLNWHAITTNHVYLSYYNIATQEVTIVQYNRKINLNSQFIQGVTVKLSKNLVKYHEAYVTRDERLLVSHLTDVPTVGSLMAYHVNSSYYLKLNYNQGGNFSKIDVKASNSYYSAVHTQKIEFESPAPPPPPPPPPPPDSDGLKWYAVVIVAAVVLLVVGVAYGVFQYIKKKRSAKNVSLLTEREEPDQDGDSEENPSRSLDERLNPTVTES